MNWIKYSVEDETVGTNKVKRIKRNKLLFEYPCSTPKCTNYEVSLLPGTYKFECYGAGTSKGTAGAYTSGVLKLLKKETFYFYLGKAPFLHQNGEHDEVFNSGIGYITYSKSGGGSADIRTKNGKWYSFESLKSRIMVAAGSGGTECGSGGSGGDIIGIDGKSGFCLNNPRNYTSFGYGGLQNGMNSYTGNFGYGYNFSVLQNKNAGGNGYYAGGSSRDYGAGSGGGSSFVSGHKGCDAINESSSENSIIHTGQPNHYSGITFYDSIIKNGNEDFFDYKGNIIEGNIGDSKITITKLNYHFSCNIHSHNYFSFIFIFLFTYSC